MTDTESNLPPVELMDPLPQPKPLFHFWRCFWLTFLVVSLGYAWHCFYVPANEIAWANDYASAKQQAAKADKPILLYFTANWCVPCRVMKRQVWADSKVKELVNAEFVPVAIDVGDPENAEVMAAYAVQGPPVTIVCDSQGNVLDWRAGRISQPVFLELLDSSHSLSGGFERIYTMCRVMRSSGLCCMTDWKPFCTPHLLGAACVGNTGVLKPNIPGPGIISVRSAEISVPLAALAEH
ncbi:thioredoxin family protein [Rhodopirellula europaea]|jgi:protein disulfide-isomerase|uniref:Thiol:disulfide interchange protein n=1 Tax=Rhodopirellula europaea SH398 TaxID=1263868 RepID=M5SH91_9BACT|nr:thioredoxin family protein [Rhodopirellula europaea]EMI25569.1 thiol:disulfide interchange protein [Rhodopirellula europaea SH398]MCR9207677.1 thioredoxin family protein [bacterium]